MKLVLTTLLVGFGSALLPFINIEAYLGALGAAVTSTTPMVVAIAAAAAVGQTIGKVVLYYAAEWAMNLSWIKRKTSSPKFQETYLRWQNRIHEHPGQTGAVLFASASLGFPPLLVVAVLAGQMRVNIVLFVSTCVIGRFLRFLVILGAVDWLAH